METGSLRRSRGLTLIELMFGITVLAILLGIGAPSFAELMRAQRTTSLTNDVVMALQTARSEAMRRSTPVTVCPTSNGTSCTGSTVWDGGMLVFTDATGTAGLLDGTDVLISSFPAAIAGYRVRGAAGISFIRFLRNGATTPAGNKDVTILRFGCSGPKARRVRTNTVGRFSTVPVNC